jgi:uncharacterized membrane protein
MSIIIGDVSRRLSKDELIKKQASELKAKLPTDKRKLFDEVMEKLYSNSGDTFKQIREARENALEALSASEFDESAYQKEVEKLHKLRRIMKQRLADAAKELAHQFNRKERKILADFFNNPPGPPAKDTDIRKRPFEKIRDPK